MRLFLLDTERIIFFSLRCSHCCRSSCRFSTVIVRRSCRCTRRYKKTYSDDTEKVLFVNLSHSVEFQKKSTVKKDRKCTVKSWRDRKRKRERGKRKRVTLNVAYYVGRRVEWHSSLETKWGPLIGPGRSQGSDYQRRYGCHRGRGRANPPGDSRWVQAFHYIRFVL